MDVDTQPSKPCRLQDLWFEDGNLVIQAGNSQFRVYRGILAARSPVFQDMLSFPQPPDSELIEGCPLVRLPDAETEVTEFLKAIFIPEYLPAFPAITTFPVIAGCLRLSHKYEVAYLRRRALIHLSSGYRTTLAEWDSSFYDEESMGRRASEITSWPIPNDLANNICVVQLAREVDALWVVPLALYRLSGRLSQQKALGTGVFHGTVYNGTSTSLSLQDQQSLLSGHRIQITSTTTKILQFFFYPLDIEGCEFPTYCLRERFYAMELNREMINDCSSFPLSVWAEDDWETLSNVCSACLPVLKRTHEEARQAFWDRLPRMYELPPWEELERMKFAAIGDVLM
ncbi:hypothetical protein DFH09DRAFT_896989 [Mycena vulgaris]|nr:hypothetical protein DFH09DRAFT_896989 [Mycena vulgaris]